MSEHPILDRQPPATTTDVGIPAASDEYSLTVGPNGPILLQDHFLVQRMQAFNRERVPERVVHAKGGGAFGFFEVTSDLRQWTRAAFLSGVGKRTPVLVRFSTVAGEQGYADTVRDPRGFAIKFYTEEGNYDLVGNNTPIFFVRDPSKFQDFIHSQKRTSGSGLRSNNAQWDFWSLSPESLHQVMFLMSDRGTPRTWRHMNGYGSHTFMWINADGERFWVKYHFKTGQGIQNFTDAEAKAMTAEDPDFHRRDLRDAIARGDHPVWRLEMQIMPFEDAANYRFNPFDLTKVWPHADYPPMTIGRLVLNHNPENFFAEIEQAAFEPNSYGGPKADVDHFRDSSWLVEAGEIMRAVYERHAEDDDFVQPRALYRQVLSPQDRDNLVSNIVGHMGADVERSVQERAVGLWRLVDAELGERLATGLRLTYRDSLKFAA